MLILTLIETREGTAIDLFPGEPRKPINPNYFSLNKPLHPTATKIRNHDLC